MEALRMITMAFGIIPAQAVAVAAELGIVDHLVGGPRSAAELARATGTHAPSLYRPRRALATREAPAEDAEGRFSSTTLGDTLRSDAPGPVRGGVIVAGAPAFTRAAGGWCRRSLRGTERGFLRVGAGGADVYVVKRILHDWADEQCVRLLKTLRRAMPQSGRVLAIDAVIAPAGMPDMGSVSDLLMMVV